MTESTQVNNFYIKVQKMAKIGYVVFFEDTIAFILLEKDFTKQTNKDLKKKFKSEKVSIFQRAEKQIEFWEDFGQKFIGMTVEDMSIEYSDIKEFKYADINKFKWTPYRKNVRSNADQTTQDYLGEISLKTDSDKIWFNHRYMKDSSKYLAVLEIKKRYEFIK